MMSGAHWVVITYLCFCTLSERTGGGRSNGRTIERRSALLFSTDKSLFGVQPTLYGVRIRKYEYRAAQTALSEASIPFAYPPDLLIKG